MKNSMLRLQHFTKELVSDYGQLQTANFTLLTLLIRPLLLLVLLLNFFSASAQSFPVQVIPQATPPSPIYFSDYADASTISSPLRVQIILNDFEVANREIRLRTYFSGGGINFQSNDLVVGAEQLFLEGGVPLVLTNVQLAPYFRFENITGISPNVYGKAIPEGAYTFCFEVYDVLTGNRLSQRSCATSVVFQNDPPFLVSPRNKDNIAETNPQNIVFQWTPRHINVSNVEYELSIVEIWDTQVDPQQAFLSSPPVFSTTTSATTYVYGPADPLFLSGKNYAWRIQAKAKQGIEEIGLFENQGYSEIYSFSYATSCDLPIGISHEVKGSTNTNIFWDDFSTDIPEYTLRYRQKNDPLSEAEGGSEWFPAKTTTNELTLWDLKPGTTYEYQLSKKCAITQSDWSLLKEFTTTLEFEEESVLDCGVSPDINLTNMEPLANIGTGATFKAGDFPVKIMEVSGGNGRFTGKGYVTLPYLKNIKVAVEFTNILINTDQEMAEGSVRTAYDASWGNILDTADVADQLDDLGDVFSGGDNIDYDVDFVITSVENIKIEDGKIQITGPNGETKTLDHDDGDTYQITDGSGNTYNIDEDEKITKGAEAAEGGQVTSQNTDGISGGSGTADAPSVDEITANGVTVTFKKSSANKYDLDSADNDFERARYPKAQTANGTDYYPIHKAVVDGQTEEFLAEISISNANITIDDLIFKTVAGTKIDTRKDGASNIIISLKGVNSYRSEEAIVTYKDEDGKYKIAASFFIHHIKQQELVKVVVVSVNGTAPLANLEQELNSIYGKAGGRFKVSSGALSLVSSDWDDNDNGVLDYDGSGLLSDYPQELKNIQQKYKQDNAGWDATAYHLFLLPDNMSLTKPLSGFMPKTRQWGYIFNAHTDDALENKSSQNLVAAHELGHGVFKLPHPFQNDENKSGSGSYWLMDYNNGDQLPYAHWAAMSDESLQLFLFQDEEDSEIADRTWFTPDWKPFSIQNSSVIRSKTGSDKVKGTVPGFRLNNGIAYDARYKPDGSFDGYFTEGNSNPYVIKLITDIKNNSSVYLFESVPNECANTYLTNYVYVDGNRNSLNFSSTNTNITPVNITTNCDKELCEEGQKFYDTYKKLIKNENLLEEDSLKGIAQLICSTDSDTVDYDILVSQLDKDAYEKRNNFWNGRDRYLFDLAIEKFWQRDDAFQLYLYALKTVNSKISEYNERLGVNFSKEDYYASLYYLNDEFLKSLESDQKVKILANILEKDAFITSGMLGIANDDESLIIKVLNSVNENKSEAKEFMDEFSHIDELYLQLQGGLDDNLDAKNYTDFILKISKLSKLAYGNGEQTTLNSKIPAITWGIENVEFILKWVKPLNDFSFYYDNNVVKVYGLCSNSSVDNGTGGVESSRECLIDGVPLNPFTDFVQLTIIESAGILPSPCNNEDAQFCGKAIIVPAIFLEYLQTKTEGKQLENFGFNVITVAGTILTGGEMAAAKAGSAVWLWAAADLTYTFSTPLLQLFREDVEQKYGKEFSDHLYKGLDAVQYIFVAKGAADLLKVNTPDIPIAVASKKAIGDDEFYRILEESIRRDKPNLPDNRVQEILDEAKSAMNKIESELSPEILDDEIAKAKKLLDDGSTSFSGTVTKSTKSLIIDDLPNPTGLFRQFAIKVEDQVKNLRAANFAKKADNSFNHFIDKSGNYYIKHNPITGELLLIDVKNKKFIAYALDEVYDSENLIKNASISEFENLLSKWKTIKGLDETDEILLNGKRIALPKGQITIVLGKYQIIDNPNNYFTTQEVLKQLGLNHLKYWELSKDLLPSSQRIHMLNLPKDIFYNDTWWTSYNKQLIEDIAKNSSKYNVIILTDVVKPTYLKELDELGGGAYKSEILELSKDFDFIVKDDFWSIKKK
ncbi:fibronectin type III domain-containing protein [Zobellia barbeyronii]|uniref:Fibronectin type-III domain-containing protein n=1 Tax=Zobellia barbeyronii TaxID=2748009 RepID=A0ABS5WD01_9FLAO|nr:fibronectin type III domain-containing protein [Zobellia barbeyronii]MBT2160027.1 hypothetical protein [Zobellia barbeyronii]